ncbi:MAG: hypothetical protein HOD92_04110 [Deltaproteobacteria bacterium]|jgi:hypothetical protein|nr:hypothetical protein [Deltaproteobacteria bacterium]MBT4527445.1 hypothetical protein [Deltaproteobacteria bacterium]
MLQTIFIILLLLINVPFLLAQSLNFIPEGKFFFNYELNQSSSNSIYNSARSEDSILESKLSKEGLNSNAVSGDIEYESLNHLFQLQYGLGDSYNLAFLVPYLSKKRSSSLEDKQGGNQSFLDNYQSASASGIGDYEIQIIKRLNYTDEHDFQMGLGYNHNNAAFNYDKNDKLALGSGTSEFFWFLKWTIFSIDSNLKTDLRYKEIYTIFNKVIDENGDTSALKRKNSRVTSLFVSSHPDDQYYGAGIEAVDQAATNIGGSNLSDGYVHYSYKLFYGLGNLVELESGPVETPWEGELFYQSVFYGLNANKTTTLGIGATFYF